MTVLEETKALLQVLRKNSLMSYLRGLAYARQRKTLGPTNSKVRGTSFLETQSYAYSSSRTTAASFTLDRLEKASEKVRLVPEGQHRTGGPARARWAKENRGDPGPHGTYPSNCLRSPWVATGSPLTTVLIQMRSRANCSLSLFESHVFYRTNCF